MINIIINNSEQTGNIIHRVSGSSLQPMISIERVNKAVILCRKLLVLFGKESDEKK